MASLTVALLVGSCSGDGSPGDAAGWPTFGFDLSNSVHNRTEAILSPDSVGGLTEAWRVETGGVSGTPIVVDGVVYFADWHGSVHALDASDGDAVWSRDVSDAPFSATVAVSEELVIAGDLGGVLHALDRRSGERAWSVNVNPLAASLFASPVIIEDTVVIGMTDTELGPDDPAFRAAVVALNLADGTERWRFNTDPDDGSKYWVSVWSTAAYDPDRRVLYVGTGDTNQPGSAGPGGSSERAPTDLPLADGVLALDHSTGEMVWFYKLIEDDERRDFDVGASPNLFTIAERDVVGVGGKSGDYVVLDRDSGEMLWKTHLTEGSAIGGVMSTAAVGGGVLYVASNDGGMGGGTVFALEAADGTVLWSRRFAPAIIGSMALANGVLYRGTFDSLSLGSVMAIDAENGTVLWTEDLQGPAAGGFSIAGGTLYAGYGSDAPPTLGPADGGLVAYRLTDTASP